MPLPCPTLTRRRTPWSSGRHGASGGRSSDPPSLCLAARSFPDGTPIGRRHCCPHALNASPGTTAALFPTLARGRQKMPLKAAPVISRAIEGGSVFRRRYSPRGVDVPRVPTRVKVPGPRATKSQNHRICGVDPNSQQRWTVYAYSLPGVGLMSFLLLYGLQRVQRSLPVNPWPCRR